VETRLKGYKYFEIERDFFNKLGVLINGHFKFGVLLLVFVRFLGGDTGNEIFAINSPIFWVREKVIWWSLHSVYVWPKK
jgi:hypothetical protein